MHRVQTRAFLALLASLSLATPAHAALNDTTLVSLGLLGAPAFDDSMAPSISDDGRHVAFASTADNLVDGDNDSVINVYARDLQTGTIVLVSQPTGEGGGAANTGNSGQYGPGISDNGRYVVFESFAANLTDDDDNAYADVFVRDLQTGTTVLASQPNGLGGAGANNANVGIAHISADGRYVVFSSYSDNLSTVDNNAVQNVFVRDMQTNTTTLVSQPTGADGSGNNGNSYPAGISADGRYVLFGSESDNLSDADNDAVENVFVRDLQTSTTTLVSQPTGTAGCPGCTGDSYAMAFSTDGRYAVFESYHNALTPNDGNTVEDAFVRDLQTNTTTLVSLPSGAADASANNGDSYAPTISDDGRHVTFESHSDNLSAIDNDALKDVFVRDLQTGTTTLVSQPSGTGGAATSNGNSSWAMISGNGRYVAFASLSDTLSSADADGVQDVFVRDLFGDPPAPPAPPVVTPPAPAPTQAPDAPPALSAVSVTNRRFVASRSCKQRRRCTRVRFTLSEAATVTVKIRRVRAGKRVGPTITLTAKARRGRGAITWRGIVLGRAVTPGRYRITVQARDAAGQRSKTVPLNVTVVKR